MDGGDGLQQFIRYAYPPNERGFCGPADHATTRDHVRSGVVDPALAEVASRFAGPMPHLRTLAAAAGVDDPFDPVVVETYWLGGPLLAAVDGQLFAREVEATFRGQPTVSWPRVRAALPDGVPTHAWHVLVTYPWLGLLDHPGGHAIGVLDQCRIRWAEVREVLPDGTVRVASRPLEHYDGRLRLGEVRTEPTPAAVLDSPGLQPVSIGDVVALHWGWVCDVLTAEQADALAVSTEDQLSLVNRVLLAPGPTDTSARPR